MDHDNLDDLISVRPDAATAVVDLLLNFTVEHYGQVVPDPYYGGVDGFSRVLDLIEEGSSSFLEALGDALFLIFDRNYLRKRFDYRLSISIKIQVRH